MCERRLPPAAAPPPHTRLTPRRLRPRIAVQRPPPRRHAADERDTHRCAAPPPHVVSNAHGRAACRTHAELTRKVYLHCRRGLGCRRVPVIVKPQTPNNHDRLAPVHLIIRAARQAEAAGTRCEVRPVRLESPSRPRVSRHTIACTQRRAYTGTAHAFC